MTYTTSTLIFANSYLTILGLIFLLATFKSLKPFTVVLANNNHFDFANKIYATAKSSKPFATSMLANRSVVIENDLLDKLELDIEIVLERLQELKDMDVEKQEIKLLSAPKSTLNIETLEYKQQEIKLLSAPKAVEVPKYFKNSKFKELKFVKLGDKQEFIHNSKTKELQTNYKALPLQQLKKMLKQIQKEVKENSIIKYSYLSRFKDLRLGDKNLIIFVDYSHTYNNDNLLLIANYDSTQYLFDISDIDYLVNLSNNNHIETSVTRHNFLNKSFLKLESENSYINLVSIKENAIMIDNTLIITDKTCDFKKYKQSSNKVIGTYEDFITQKPSLVEVCNKKYLNDLIKRFKLALKTNQDIITIGSKKINICDEAIKQSLSCLKYVSLAKIKAKDDITLSIVSYINGGIEFILLKIDTDNFSIMFMIDSVEAEEIVTVGNNPKVEKQEIKLLPAGKPVYRELEKLEVKVPHTVTSAKKSVTKKENPLMSSLISLSKYAYNGTSFDPKKRGQSFINDVKINLEYYKRQLGDVYNENKILSLYLDILSAQSRLLSPMITGPARFPVAKNEKNHESYRNKYKNLELYIEKMLKIKTRNENKQAVVDGGGELQIARKKLENLKKDHDLMKKANVIMRKKPKNEMTDSKVEKLKELGFSLSLINELKDLKTFAGYQLTNNLAKIKNTEIRIKTLEKKESATNKSWVITQDDIEVEITIDFDLDRIIIRHDSKPSFEVIKELKSLGMHWSPKNKGWQRKITNNALYRLKGTDYQYNREV